jgi:hypothetical protein
VNADRAYRESWLRSMINHRQRRISTGDQFGEEDLSAV